jgi:hypothetical protein
MTILERMRERSAKVAATTVIAAPQPLKAIGGNGNEEIKVANNWASWIKYLNAVDAHPDQRPAFVDQLNRATGWKMS